MRLFGFINIHPKKYQCNYYNDEIYPFRFFLTDIWDIV